MDTSQSQSDSRGQEPKSLLTTGCYYVQGEILDLAAALDTAALPSDPALVRSQLAAVRECRQRLHEHMMAMEAPAGLYDYIETESPASTSELGGLCSEHCELDRRLGTLEQRLESFNPADPQAANEIRDCARRLAELTCDHQQHVSRVVGRFGDPESPTPR